MVLSITKREYDSLIRAYIIGVSLYNSNKSVKVKQVKGRKVLTVIVR